MNLGLDTFVVPDGSAIVFDDRKQDLMRLPKPILTVLWIDGSLIKEPIGSEGESREMVAALSRYETHIRRLIFG